MKSIQSIVSTLLLSTNLIASTLISKASAQNIPESDCIKAILGGTACGYDCKVSGDGREAACAEWPEGRCRAAFETVSCGPPAPDNWTSNYDDDDDDDDYFDDRLRDRDRYRDCDCDCDRDRDR